MRWPGAAAFNLFLTGWWGLCSHGCGPHTQRYTRPPAQPNIHDSLFSLRKSPGGAWGHMYNSGLREDGCNRCC